jgi:hypothetical protein
VNNFHKFSESLPHLVSSRPDAIRRQAAQSVLPEGASLIPERRKANWDPFYGSSGGPGAHGGGGSSFFHAERPYFPEVEDPSRQQFPHDRRRANALWRMFYKYDPMFGNAVELYADMLVSDFDIELPTNDAGSSIKATYEYMCDKCKIVEVLKQMIIEYLVIGETFPHTFFNDELGIWTYVGFHNPDFVDVKDAHLINMDPILTFEPDDQLRRLLSDSSMEALEIRRKFPSDFVARVLARQPIRLSPTNASMVARKLHPYDIRGASLATRLWRMFMVEDAVYNSTINTFRRVANPIRVVKLGSEADGWIPDPEQEARFLDMLAQAETDPAAIIVWNYGVKFEAWGINDRATTIRGEIDTIERVKMQALGLSKGFLSGEANYASVKSGLQVFLRRLLSLRQYIENVWLMPKFFRPIAVINEWTSMQGSSDSHAITKTAQAVQDDSQYILPILKWKNQLDPDIDKDRLDALSQIEKTFGIKIAPSTVMSTVGMDFVNNEEKALAEFKKSKENQLKTLGPQLSRIYNESTGQGKATPGAGALPAKPSTAQPRSAPPDASHPPGSADVGGAAALSEKVESPSSGDDNLKI